MYLKRNAKSTKVHLALRFKCSFHVCLQKPFIFEWKNSFFKMLTVFFFREVSGWEGPKAEKPSPAQNFPEKNKIIKNGQNFENAVFPFKNEGFLQKNMKTAFKT